MYKIRRQSRLQSLTNAGFTNFEARAFSRISRTVPYMKPLVKERQTEYNKMLKRALKQGVPATERDKAWLTHIKRRYVAMGWKSKKDTWGSTVAFRMVKAKEKEYKLKHPEYQSPWTKKSKSRGDFQAKLDATYEGQQKYPTGRAYPRKGKGG